MKGVNKLIQVLNISKSYRIQSNTKQNALSTSKTRTVEALKNVSLEVKKGEVFGIIGESGAGKSTLIRLLNRLETPDSGEIMIDGSDLAKLTEQALNIRRRKIGMIFQQFNLLNSRDVLGNVLLPLELDGISKQESKERAIRWLDRVGLKDKQHARISQLSGGQKQRVAIARALVTNPDILLCDEATSALDPKTTRDILKLIADLSKSLHLTVVLITHQLEVVEAICDRVAFMEQGRVLSIEPVSHFKLKEAFA
jgi:D-methionine transport system ATP-binding protein